MRAEWHGAKLVPPLMGAATKAPGNPLAKSHCEVYCVARAEQKPTVKGAQQAVLMQVVLLAAVVATAVADPVAGQYLRGAHRA